MADDAPSGSLLFNSVAEADRATLMAEGRDVRYRMGETIYARTEPGETMLLLRSGRVEISVTALSGRKSVLNHMGPGEALGEIAMFDGGLRSADAVAATDVEGLRFHRRDVVAFLSARPDAMLGLVRELCAKVRNASEMFTTQAETDATARLARGLLRLGEKWGATDADGSVRIAESFSQSDLGEFAGLSRENVNRRLRTWAADGLIALDGGRLVLLDAEGLEELAQV